MFALRRLLPLGKSIAGKVRIAVPKLRYCQPSFYKPKIKTSFNLKSEVIQDVVLFSFENKKFFILLNLFSITQCFFWTWMGLFLFRIIRDPAFEIRTPGFWAKLLEKERQHSIILSGFSLFLGFSTLIGSVFYSVRSVRKLILHKGGNEITILTYNLPGFNTFKVPLSKISASQHRTKAKKFISLKIKNKFFYYLLDVNGEFLNPVLFDFTAGIKRNM